MVGIEKLVIIVIVEIEIHCGVNEIIGFDIGFMNNEFCLLKCGEMWKIVIFVWKKLF